MRNRSFGKRLMRTMMALAVGGSAFQLSGCDPNVRSSILNGLSSTTTSLADTLIGAFFVSLQNDNTGTTGGTTGGVTTTF